ncbi:hypothetical protein BsWGS_03079 [Bradybaena similaris]
MKAESTHTNKCEISPSAVAEYNRTYTLSRLFSSYLNPPPPPTYSIQSHPAHAMPFCLLQTMSAASMPSPHHSPLSLNLVCMCSNWPPTLPLHILPCWCQRKVFQGRDPFH